MVKGNSKRQPEKEKSPFSGYYKVIELPILVGMFFLAAINTGAQSIAEKLIQIQEVYSLEGKEDPNYYFYFPSDIESDLKGNIYVVDTYNSRIQIFDVKGDFLGTIRRQGSGPLEFNKPEDIYIDEKNNKIYICDTRNWRIQISTLEGRFIRSIKLKFLPQRITLRDSYLYISSFPSTRGEENGIIKKININGNIAYEFLSFIKTKEISVYLLYNMILMKKDKKGNLVIARKWGPNQIMIFDINDRLQKEFKVIYKASKWVKPGIIDFPLKNDEDIDKIPFVIADMTFDSNSNYYFLAGNIEKNLDGSIERRREIYKYSSKGVYLGTIILPIPAKLIHIDIQNNLYIIDENFILRKYKFEE